MSDSITLAIVWTIIGYISGSLPFSVWMGRLFLRTDIRQQGEDRNPGSANVFKAGGKRKWWVGLSALLLDGFKGLIPVALAYYNFKVDGWGLAAVALAPVAGHAFSIFLNFQGGKALATTFGIWTALTVYRVPFVLGGFFILFAVLLSNNAWAVMLGMLGVLGYLLITHAEPVFMLIWAGNMAILMWKHRNELRQPVGLNPRFRKS
jgi:acyl phosphate:glycerol-3-phosphate acyltransferase